MSGGHFDYKQYHISDIAEQIERLIEENGQVDYRTWSEATIEEFKTAVASLRLASVMVQRIDWLVSGDYSEKSFHERLEEDLDKL